ncbi:MAG: heme A synthase [Gemmatimonadales bacterium]|jgi:heme A synthase|nr:MAG: heme A synthase [Gemmatimonadales bacterium]
MPQHFRAFVVTVVWTLGLLLLGSVVHATESSLACPDWPTCFGTMLPEMEGGVFWEHLHRLVAGGLILMFALATWLAFQATGKGSWIRVASVSGLFLLLVQAVFGGLTVIYRLPDAISTSHLSMALAFLALATVLAAATSPRREARMPLAPKVRDVLRGWGLGALILIFLQSVIGGVVRHTDAGMACPDFPTCIGVWIPPLENHLVAVHFVHRVVGLLAALVVLALAWKLARAGAPSFVRRVAHAAAGLVLVQFTLGVISVFTVLAVVPVSFHTLGAAGLVSLLTLLTTWGRLGPVREATEVPGSAAVREH